MNGKVLVIGIGSFFLLFFIAESWLMRSLLAPLSKVETSYIRTNREDKKVIR